ncbi:MAG: caspase family protein [Bryobacteraceae bacterium]|nr:caspase family protein [Bryobacteraceae bacterium]
MGDGALTRVITLAAACLAPLFAQTTSAPERKAIVIGNALYRSLPQAGTAAADARIVANTLGELKFQVTLVENRTIEQMARDINRFLSSLSPGDAAVFYYAGYAAQSAGENYLLPSDLTLDKDLDFAAYSMKRVVREMEARRLQPAIVVIDAARTAPEVAAKYPDAGLALVDLRGPETVAAFSTLPGRLAPAAANRSTGLYAESLVRQLKIPGLSLNDVFSQLKRSVSEASKGEQTPSEISTAVRDFIFHPRPPQLAEWERLRASTDLAAIAAFRLRYPNDPLAAEAARRMEEIEWQAVATSKDPLAMRAYLNKYPSGAFAPLAQATLELLAREAASAGKDAILAVVERYREAYQNEDLERLKALRPGLTRNELRALEETFRFARQIRMDLEAAGEPRIDGDSATLRSKMTIQLRDERGMNPPARADVVIKLRRSADGWLIDSIQ